jgi:hypothetical protein
MIDRANVGSFTKKEEIGGRPGEEP